MRATVRRLACALGAVLALVTATRRAQADDGRVHVVLLDGSEVQGDLVEKIPGDHLTLQLATGEIRVIPWAAISSTNPVESRPDLLPELAPPPPANPDSFGFGTSTYGVSTNKNDIPWPRPDRTPSPFAGSHFYLGLASGLGTPVGYGGLVAAWDPVPYLELEAGVGAGGHFGYAASAMARLELPLFRSMRMGFGLGFSENWLSAAQTAPDGSQAYAPRVSRWLNVEFLDQSFAFGSSGFFRISTGFAFNLNRSAYDAMCSPAARDPSSSFYESACTDKGFPVTPKALASDQHPPFVPYFGFEILWRLS